MLFILIHSKQLFCFQPKPLMQTPVTIAEPIVPKEPPPEFEFLADPPTISALDLYVNPFLM